ITTPKSTTLSLHDALPILTALKSVDLPTFGNPTIPALSISADGTAIAQPPQLLEGRPLYRPEIRRTRRSASFNHQGRKPSGRRRSEEHTSELQSRGHLVCR